MTRLLPCVPLSACEHFIIQVGGLVWSRREFDLDMERKREGRHCGLPHPGEKTNGRKRRTCSPGEVSQNEGGLNCENAQELQGSQRSESTACRRPGVALGSRRCAHSLICHIVQQFPPLKVEGKEGSGGSRAPMAKSTWSRVGWAFTGKGPQLIPMTGCPSAAWDCGTSWEKVLGVLVQ